jgi:hypothetical protein
MNETCLKAVGIHLIQRDLVVDRFLVHVTGSEEYVYVFSLLFVIQLLT